MIKCFFMNEKRLDLAPIILFVFNRPWHTQQTLEALQQNELAKDSVLYVFADGAKSDADEIQLEGVRKTREIIHMIRGFKEVHIEESEKNKGLANSVIYGVTKTIKQHGKAIVVEDDIVVHPFFLRYMNEALDFYEKDARIFMIGGFRLNFKIPWWYFHDVYIVHRSCSWGWATWKNRWEIADWEVSDYSSFVNNSREIDRFNRGGEDMFPMLQGQMEGRLDSWAIRWDYCMYKNEGYCIWPKYSYVRNIGFDGSGVHCGKDNKDYVLELQSHNIPCKISFVKNISYRKRVENAFRSFCNPKPKMSLVNRLKRFGVLIVRKIRE